VTVVIETQECTDKDPLDILERLVRDHPSDIYEIPLSDIVDAFLAELESIVDSGSFNDLDRLSEFVLLASTLLEWKSKCLLNQETDSEDDEELYALEQRDALIGRFIELQVYAKMALRFSLMIERAALSIPRTAGLEDRFANIAPDLLADVDKFALRDTFRNVIDRAIPEDVQINHVTVDKVSVSETIAVLERRLRSTRMVTFRELTRYLSDRIDIIVHFLALLELHKRGTVSLNQAETFGDLEIEWIAI
jgi:segregation and condensation protein A